jgi:hypothetical protein
MLISGLLATEAALTVIPKQWHLYVVDLEPRVGPPFETSWTCSGL